MLSVLLASAGVPASTDDFRRAFVEGRRALMAADFGAAEREFGREMRVADADAHSRAIALVRGNEAQALSLGREVEALRTDPALQGMIFDASDALPAELAPEPPLRVSDAPCTNATLAERHVEYGVLDVAPNGTLTLIRASPPFDERRDLELGVNVGCPHLRERIRATFTSGVDMSVTVAPMVTGRRQTECVARISKEMEDRK